MTELGELLQARGWTLAVAESLTGGLLTDGAARRPGAAEWLRGGLVAYHPQVKRDLLGIGDHHVVSEAAARAMAEHVARLLGADVGVAVTGVGGPDPDEKGLPPGTVWLAVHLPRPDGTTASLHHLDGDPKEIVEATCRLALDTLRRRLAGR